MGTSRSVVSSWAGVGVVDSLGEVATGSAHKVVVVAANVRIIVGMPRLGLIASDSWVFSGTFPRGGECGGVVRTERSGYIHV